MDTRISRMFLRLRNTYMRSSNIKYAGDADCNDAVAFDAASVFRSYDIPLL